ncbi:MAG: diguanylate cyclase [Bdellovibrionota bacterium]
MSDPIAELRSEFSVFIVESDVAISHALVELVNTFGYTNVSVWPTAATALAAARQAPPHLVLFDFEHFEEQAALALTEINSISPEILVILMMNFAQTLAGLEIVGRGLAFDCITRPFISNLELQQKLDRAAQRLYYQFESEQLRESAEGRTFHGTLGDLDAKDDMKTVAGSEPVPEAAAPQPANEGVVNEFLARVAVTRDLDETIEIFLEAMANETNAPVVYLKYLPTHASLLIAHTSRLPIDKYRGLGVDFKKEGIANAGDLLRDPSDIKPLGDLIRGLFQKDSFIAIPHLNDGDAHGVFVLLGEIDVSNSASRPLALLGIFELAWKRNLTVKEKHGLDILDPLTGTANRRQFIQKLDEEISRSRRILLPLSAITFDVDAFKKLNEKIGAQQVDAILKAVASVLKKTARVSDIVARTGPDEFTMLLPHTPGMGAAIKAERLRRVIEGMKFPLLSAPVTVSVGVSEYPSICSDGEALVRTADEALSQVRAAGGNKVCLATAPAGHQLEFAPREVPAGGRGSS